MLRTLPCALNSLYHVYWLGDLLKLNAIEVLAIMTFASFRLRAEWAEQTITSNHENGIANSYLIKSFGSVFLVSKSQKVSLLALYQ